MLLLCVCMTKARHWHDMAQMPVQQVRDAREHLCCSAETLEHICFRNLQPLLLVQLAVSYCMHEPLV